MEALQIMPVMAQRRNSNLGEFAEDATVVTDDTKGKRPLFIEANTVEATAFEGRLHNSSIRQRQRGYIVARLVH